MGLSTALSFSFLSLFGPQLISCPHPNIPSVFPFPSPPATSNVCIHYCHRNPSALSFFLFLNSPINSAQRNHVQSIPRIKLSHFFSSMLTKIHDILKYMIWSQHKPREISCFMCKTVCTGSILYTPLCNRMPSVTL